MAGGLSGDALKALEAVQAGKDPAVEVYGESGVPDPDTIVEADDVQQMDTGSTLDGLLGEQQPVDDGPSPDEELDEKELSPSDGGNQEELLITDDKGRRKVKVDFNDKEKMKKYVKMAYGMRKFQAERDRAQQKLKGFEGLDPTKARETMEHWSNIEQAYQNGGVAGLVDLIEGRQGAYRELEQGIVDKYEQRRNATPEELELFDAQEREQQRSKEIEAIRRENEDFRKKMEQEREIQETKAMESRVHPSFEKYRFAGKLGDETDEHLFDDMLWNSALKKLEPYESEGLDITREMVEKAFRDTSNAIRRRIKVQADKKVKRTVRQKKQEATENAQQRALKGYSENSTAQEARDLIGKQGGLTDLLKGWGKYGKHFKG